MNKRAKGWTGLLVFFAVFDSASAAERAENPLRILFRRIRAMLCLWFAVFLGFCATAAFLKLADFSRAIAGGLAVAFAVAAVLWLRTRRFAGSIEEARPQKPEIELPHQAPVNGDAVLENRGDGPSVGRSSRDLASVSAIQEALAHADLVEQYVSKDVPEPATAYNHARSLVSSSERMMKTLHRVPSDNKLVTDFQKALQALRLVVLDYADFAGDRSRAIKLIQTLAEQLRQLLDRYARGTPS